MEVPQGFEKWYGSSVVLLLLKTMYGLKQVAIEYWRTPLKAIREMCLRRSTAGPCVYYRWTENGLNLWSSWIDDLLCCATSKDDLDQGKQILKKHFELDEVGALAEHLGCKVEYNPVAGYMKLSQLVLL
jgi:hypothetical protein